MSGQIEIVRAGPLVTVQDGGRTGYFASGISASGPMDVGAFDRAGALLSEAASSGLEITTAGIGFIVTGQGVDAGFAGGKFSLKINGKKRKWARNHRLKSGDEIEISPGSAGNYGYVRFNAELDVPLVLGSRSTNLIVGLGGFSGRALKSGDVLPLTITQNTGVPGAVSPPQKTSEPIGFVWGIHAEKFNAATRLKFTGARFQVSRKLDRMGVRLEDLENTFADARILSLVSDAIVPGDIQILGDGTPIVLMRDHQPTGGYPRIGTVVSADLDRFAQMRPGTSVQFTPIGIARAHGMARGKRR